MTDGTATFSDTYTRGGFKVYGHKGNVTVTKRNARSVYVEGTVASVEKDGAARHVTNRKFVFWKTAEDGRACFKATVGTGVVWF